MPATEGRRRAVLTLIAPLLLATVRIGPGQRPPPRRSDLPLHPRGRPYPAEPLGGQPGRPAGAGRLPGRRGAERLRVRRPRPAARDLRRLHGHRVRRVDRALRPSRLVRDGPQPRAEYSDGLPSTTFSAQDRGVMRRWYQRWRADGVFCVVYSRRTRTARPTA
jgi:hypothetical protein